jgi:hypothetical protein
MVGMALPRSRAALAFALVALVSFAIGLLAAGRLVSTGGPGTPQTASASGPASPFDANPPGPRIVLDPAKIELLPDASLRLDLPQGFGGGSADGAGAR